MHLFEDGNFVCLVIGCPLYHQAMVAVLWRELQSDTVAAGLLQRCVVRCSSRQYSEAAMRAEHCGADRSSGAKEVTCSAAPGTAALSASPPAD